MSREAEALEIDMLEKIKKINFKELNRKKNLKDISKYKAEEEADLLISYKNQSNPDDASKIILDEQLEDEP